MKNRRTRIILIAALALVLVAAVIALVTFHDRAASAPQPSAALEETVTAVPSEAPPETETPEETAPGEETLPTEAPETAEPDAAPADTPAPTPTPTPTPAPTPEAQTVTITIVCHTALQSADLSDAVRAVLPAGGVLLQRTVTLEAGDTAWSVTQRACRDAGVSMEASFSAAQGAVYVEGIGHLYEFDCGQGSGWIYKVNGTTPGRGCDSYPVKAGDALLWAYTCDYGNDL